MEQFDGDLVIAGMRGWKYEPIFERARQSKCAERIRLLEFVDDRYLAGLYAGAELLVCPSLYEGFGFTPLEAMACGTPVAASAGGSLPEVLGEAAVVVQGFDSEQWADEVAGLLEDETVREQLRKRGKEHIKQYRWSRTAAETLAVYEEIAGS